MIFNSTEVNSYTYSSDYQIIDGALKSRWSDFDLLCNELSEFEPRDLSDFTSEKNVEIERLVKLNPNASYDQLVELVDSQIRFAAQPDFQIFLKFGGRVQIEYATVSLLSHALCEAVINTVLAIALSKKGSHDIFSILDRVEIKEKWCVAPKVISPLYELKKGEALFQSLTHLTNTRNTLVHYKISLEMDGKSVLSGRPLKRESVQEKIQWLKRFYSLPYDLLEHVARETSDNSLQLLLDRGAISKAEPHRKCAI